MSNTYTIANTLHPNTGIGITTATNHGFINNGISNAVPSAIVTMSENPDTMKVKGRLVLNGEDLNERLERIEILLNIPTRDIEMEERHPKLKKMWEDYNRELAKYKTWSALKGEK